VQYRALVEGLSSRMWSAYTGFLIWKTQNPWLGLRGQMYDWTLEPSAALYGIRAATEPVHVQLCPRRGGEVQVVNTTLWSVTAKVRFVGQRRGVQGCVWSSSARETRPAVWLGVWLCEGPISPLSHSPRVLLPPPAPAPDLMHTCPGGGAGSHT
jgi:hypothetical protein